MPSWILPDKLRPKLNRPMGDLVSGSNIDLGELLRKVIATEHPTLLILVGDNVSRSAADAGIAANVMIIDRHEQRRTMPDYAYRSVKVIKARNPAGRIDQEARLALGRAIRGEAEVVEIEGEEDLLAIIAVVDAPLGSLVVYGQPNEGVVLVRVTNESKRRAEMILGQMQRVD